MATRSIDRIVKAIATLEGEGLLVHRPFPTQTPWDTRPLSQGLSAEGYQSSLRANWICRGVVSVLL
jgi:hypothetical protein